MLMKVRTACENRVKFLDARELTTNETASVLPHLSGADEGRVEPAGSRGSQPCLMADANLCTS